MAEMEDTHFETDNPIQCSALRKNGFVMLKARPCKIVEMSTGKHGHDMVHLVGIDIFNGKKYEDVCPSAQSMDVPQVKREDYQVTDIQDGFLCLINESGEIREDLKVPDGDLGTQMRADFEGGKEVLCVVMQYRGEACVEKQIIVGEWIFYVGENDTSSLNDCIQSFIQDGAELRLVDLIQKARCEDIDSIFDSMVLSGKYNDYTAMKQIVTCSNKANAEVKKLICKKIIDIGLAIHFQFFLNENGKNCKLSLKTIENLIENLNKTQNPSLVLFTAKQLKKVKSNRRKKIKGVEKFCALKQNLALCGDILTKQNLICVGENAGKPKTTNEAGRR